MSVLEAANSICRCVGIGTLYMAKEFAFQKVLAKCCAVQRYKRLFATWAVLVNCLSNQFLTRTRVTSDQDTCIGRRDAFQPVNDRLHCVTAINDLLEPKFFIESLVKIRIITLKSLSRRSFVGRSTNAVWVNGFFNEIEGTLLHCFDCFRNRTMTGNDDHLAVRK